MSRDFLTAKVEKDKNNDYDLQSNEWYSVDKEDVHHYVFAECSRLNTEAQTMKHQFRMYRYLYGNAEAFFVPTIANNNNNESAYQPDNRLVANVSQSIVDTVASMISKNEPHPQSFTQGENNYKLRQKAKLQNAFFNGVADTCTSTGKNLYEVLKQVDLDAFILGTGAIQIYDDEDEIRAERVLPDEILVDPEDGIFMEPRCIYRIKWIHKSILERMFPKKKDAIHQSMINSTSQGSQLNTNTQLIEVAEAWHLKSGKKSTDGYHTMCIPGCTLLLEPYKKSYFPIQFFRFKDRPIGFWGVGLIEELKSLQIRLNEVLQLIQQAQELVAAPIAFVENGSGVQSDHLLANNIFREVNYNAGHAMPSIQTPNAIQTEMYNERDWLINQMFQISGVSQANASGQKPPDLKSGIAIEMVSDIAAQRFAVISQRKERLVVQLYKLVLSVGKDIYDRNPKLAVRTLLKGNKYLTEIPFSEIADIEEDEFSIECFPMSDLPSDPQGKMDRLMQMVQAGWVSREDAMNEMQLVDTDFYTNLQTAPLNLIRKVLSRMVNDGKPYTPTPFMNLQLALSEASNTLQLAELDNVDEPNVQLVRDFINNINDLLQQQNPPAPPAQPQGLPAGQVAAGQAPQTSPPPTVSPPAAQQ